MFSRLRKRFTYASVAVTLVLMFALAAVASEPHPAFWETCRTGEGAGQCNIPRGVATAPAGPPNAGHVFVADQSNNRIGEFDAWGQFVKSWGWDVDATDPSTGFETCTAASGHTCKLTIRGARAGQFAAPQGVAVDGSGNVYAVDINNRRVQKFSPAGQFLLAWGGDVVASGLDDSGANEQQTVTVPATVTAGTFKLTLISATGFGTFATASNQVQAGTSSGEFEVGDELSASFGIAAGTTITAISGNTLTLSANTTEPATNLALTARETTAAIEWNAPATGAGGLQEKLEALPVIGAGNVTVTGGPGASGTPFTVTFSGGLLAHDDVEQMTATGLLTGGSAAVATALNGGGPEICKSTDICKAGDTGTANGQFGAWAVGSFVAVGPADKVYVGDVGRIQRFDTGGAWQESIAAGLTTSQKVQSLAVDPSGNVYAGINGESNVRKWSSGGAVLTPVTVTLPRALASDSAGNLYAVSDTSKPLIRKFNSSGAELESWGQEEPPTPKLAESTGIATGSACLTTGADVYVANNIPSFLRAYGPVPDKTNVCPPPAIPPLIASQYAVSADTKGATLKATINPEFWPDTVYHVEYGTGKCGEGGCPLASPETLLTNKVLSSPLEIPAVVLAGLEPGAAYHYRFVARSGGGGPVYGQEKTFTTFPLATEPKTDCPNQAYRGGASANLPDCRAYEMVSPIDKEGGDIAVQDNIDNEPAGLDQSSADGEKLTYSSYGAFGGSESTPYTSQYIATRHEGEGWSSESISPPIEGRSPLNGRRDLDNQYKAFGEDLCSGWLVQFTEPTLDPAAPSGYADLYKRENCGGGTYRALSTATPEHTNPAEFLPELQGTSTNGDCAVFRARGKLTPDGSEHVDLNGIGNFELYENCGGTLRLVSLLPDGTASEQDSSVGTPGRNANHDGSVWRAVSTDGSRVYWSVSIDGGLTATLYVRENAAQPQSAISGGVCTEETKACTYRVSPLNGAVRFRGATPSGSKALYTVGHELYEYDFKGKASTLIANGVEGVLGTSEDLSRIYFASTEVLTGAEENSVGRTAEAGKPNVYLKEEGILRFVATLAAGDLPRQGNEVGPVSASPGQHTARITPNGAVAAFTSTASPTGYDNTDINSGNADAEIYVYDAGANGGAGALVCLSCDPSGARPVGRNVTSVGTFPNSITPIWAAAYVAPWPTQLRASNVLSSDGSRLFFESYGSLVLRDSNGARDVYEWEAASSKEECEADGAELFVAGAGGCLSLISSGQSPQDSEFIEATPNGSDVFFATSSSLLPQDPGLTDIYDARVRGGLPSPPATPAACEGEACQNTPSPAGDATPGSLTFSGEGNLVSPLVVRVKPKTGPLTRAQRLARALRACKREPKRKRARCRTLARKRYGPAKKAGRATNDRRAGR